MISAQTALEYDKVISIIATFTCSTPGRKAVMSMVPALDIDQIRLRLNEVDEMKSVLADVGRPPLSGNADLTELLAKLTTEGYVLDAESLQSVRDAAETVGRCYAFLSPIEDIPAIDEHVELLVKLPALVKRLKESIGDRGEILDSASFQLRAIREDLREERIAIRRTLERLLGDDNLAPVFQDRLITERNGRYVIPIKADYRGKVKGFVHDQSSSGQTLFVEPSNTLERNNKVQQLIREEKAEEDKILRELSLLVAGHQEELLENQRLMSLLDQLQAMARFSIDTDSNAPNIVDQISFDLKQARHPLLLLNAEGKGTGIDVIPVDVELGTEHRVLVISGPNTGGKTVVLKTMGLAVLLVRAGCHIPCLPDSSLYPFTRIFADIGDHQGIEEGLSTYSSHLVRMKAISEEADASSLILIDEAGTGTDPAEGGALILAALDQLSERGARTVLTTHLRLVKQYAATRESAINAAVEFDMKGMRPTYRLHYGIPGESNALSIARRLGLSEELIERAETYIDEGDKQGIQLFQELNESKRQLEEQLQLAERLQKEAAADRNRVKLLLDSVQQKRQKIIDRAVDKGERLVRKAESDVKTLVVKDKADRKNALKQQRELSTLRQDLDKHRSKPTAIGPTPTEVDTGEVLYVPMLGVDGTVQSVKGKKVELLIGDKRTVLTFSSLQQYQPRRYVKSGETRINKRPTAGPVSSVVDLAGMRVEEAIDRLEPIIDQALLSGMIELELKHGVGTGALRKGIRSYLATHKGIASYHAAENERGGDRVTIAVLKG